jgi:Ala-tRNA(Pro) deacylase
MPRKLGRAMSAKQAGAAAAIPSDALIEINSSVELWQIVEIFEFQREGSTMGIAATLAEYLRRQDAKYNVVEHPHTATALESARTGHVALNRLAKGVVLRGSDGFVLAVLPASSHIQFSRLHQQLGADLDMASEEQIETLFPDCERGAVPAIGAAYGLKVIVDDSLANEPEIYFEGGDHASLVHTSGSTFRELLADARHGQFTERG